MPEIAEVFTIASGLASLLGVPLQTGVHVQGVSHPLLKWSRPTLWEIKILTARSFKGAERYFSLTEDAPVTGYSPSGIIHTGKVMRLQFEHTRRVLDFHFGMTGRLGLVDSKHTRVAFNFESKFLYFIDPRKFGWVEIKLNDSTVTVGQCASLFNLRDFWNICSTPRAIRDVLTDQSLIAGLGNYMVNEILWKAKVHPFRPAENLNANEMYNIRQATDDIILASAKAGGATLVDYFGLAGDPGQFAKEFNAYGRTECRRCRGPINVLRRSKSDRSSFVCLTCSPLKP